MLSQIHAAMPPSCQSGMSGRPDLGHNARPGPSDARGAAPASIPGAAVTKSISVSTAVISGVSTSRKLRTEPLIRPHISAGSAMPRPAQTPFFQSMPRGTSGQALIRTAAGRTACQMSMYGWPVTSTAPASRRRPTSAAIRASLLPATRWSHSTPTRRLRRRAEPVELCGQVVQPVQRLDDDALDPQVVPPDPLDQGRVVDAFDPDPGRPRGPGAQAGDLDRAGGGPLRAAGADLRADQGDRRRRRSRTTPSDSGNVLVRPARSSSVTVVDVQVTTAPQKPEAMSSATTSGVAATTGTGARRRRCSGSRSGSEHTAGSRAGTLPAGGPIRRNDSPRRRSRRISPRGGGAPGAGVQTRSSPGCLGSADEDPLRVDRWRRALHATGSVGRDESSPWPRNPRHRSAQTRGDNRRVGLPDTGGRIPCPCGDRADLGAGPHHDARRGRPVRHRRDLLPTQFRCSASGDASHV